MNSLNLFRSKDLFISSTVTRLFSESLKFTKLVRLCLDDCGINDTTLMLLAPGVCHKHCTVHIIFEIDRNPYSDNALADFVRYVYSNEPHTGSLKLMVLSVTHTCRLHRNLVDKINFLRLLVSRPELTLGCMDELSAKDKGIQAQKEGMALLQLRPDLNFRSPHH